jgi:folate-binding protein YgfZ
MEQGKPVGIWAYTARRIAAGVARIFVDTDRRTLPNELGVPSENLAFGKGCYPGQESVAKIVNRGTPPRRLVRLHLDGSQERFVDSGTVLTSMTDPDTTVGFLGSMSYHRELGPLGLGLVNKGIDDSATLLADTVPVRIETL